MNRTLEEMARGPLQVVVRGLRPGARQGAREPPAGMDAATAALFPAEFEESELGPIPKGWRVGTLGDITDIAIGGDWGSEESFDSAVEVVCLTVLI